MQIQRVQLLQPHKLRVESRAVGDVVILELEVQRLPGNPVRDLTELSFMAVDFLPPAVVTSALRGTGYIQRRR